MKEPKIRTVLDVLDHSEFLRLLNRGADLKANKLNLKKLKGMKKP